jgi:hypothetical protein
MSSSQVVQLNRKAQPQSELSKAAAQQILTDRAVRSMADAIFKQLQDEGCQAKDIINVSSQLLGLVTIQITESDAR